MKFLLTRNVQNRIGGSGSPLPPLESHRFIKDLFVLVDDPETDDAISWNQGGITIIIKNADKLKINLQDGHMSGMLFESFKRTLSKFGFKLNKRNKEFKEYRHNFFRQVHSSLLGRISKKANRKMIENRAKKQYGESAPQV